MAQPTDTARKTPRGRSAAAPVPAVVVDLAATEPAWKAHEGRFRALARSAVKPAALNLTQAASIAIAAVNNLLSRRAELVALYRDPPFARLEAVISIALAAPLILPPAACSISFGSRASADARSRAPCGRTWSSASPAFASACSWCASTGSPLSRIRPISAAARP